MKMNLISQLMELRLKKKPNVRNGREVIVDAS
jgi:hypothetical protein